MKILEGQYIPTGNSEERNSNVILVGEKPSDYFLKHPEMRYLGNYNNPKSKTDVRLQEYIKKYLGQVYITDMVKTEGLSGADFVAEWGAEPMHKKLLLQEFDNKKPRIIVAMGRNVEKLLRKEFPQYNITYIVHPSATRYPKNLTKWGEQFKQVGK